MLIFTEILLIMDDLNMITVSGEKYLVEKEAASKYGLSIHWFRRARYEKDSPPYHKMKGKIYYKESSLEEWFRNNMVLVLHEGM